MLPDPSPLIDTLYEQALAGDGGLPLAALGECLGVEIGRAHV